MIRKLIAIVIFTSICYAQESALHKLSFEILGGSSVSTISVFDEEDMNIIGFNGSARILWEPEKLLRIGIEGGFLHLAHSKEEDIATEFGLTKRSNSLNAYPLMLNFNMKVWKLEFMLGLGAAYISSKINAFNDVSESDVITSTKMFGVGYSYYFTDRLSIGCEVKSYSFSTPDVTVVTFQLKSKYSFFTW